ncbi:MAG TPA: transcription antitermination factor NusB [Solirubrobacteraceae bacterium]
MAVATLSPARRAAHAVVLRTLSEGAYADRALHGEARGLEPRDRALAKQLAFGTVQRRLTLDHVIAAHVDRALDPTVRAALQLGLFQLMFLDGVAAHAAIGEAVELAKPNPGHRLVNAVLRRVQREGVELPSDATPEGASIRYSHPRWIVDLWWDWLGPDETRALLAADNEPAELALRVNALVDYDLDDVPGRREGETIVVDGPFDAVAHPGYAAGAFTPQSRASQLVARALAPAPGERVLDLCAAPGGKTTHLAALMEGTGEVVAVERNPQRARALQATAARLRAANVTVVTADANDYDGAGRFDRVLLDPPCSGLGTLRSHPDLRWRTSPEAVERLAAEQDVLLASARRALAPGGALVYSVCTLSPREERLVTATVQRTFPHVDGTDGFYIARDGG